MLEFFHFWFVDCFITGATTAGGVFGIVEIICAFLWFFYGRKKGEDTMRTTEEKAKGFARWSFILLFVFSTFFYAPYTLYKSEKHAKEVAQKERDDRSAKLDGFINQTIAGDELGNTNSFIFLQVTVGNSGKSPSIAESYELEVALTNKTLIDADLIDFSDEYKLNTVKSDSRITYTLKQPELISEKTSRAIQPGEAPRGWIAFKLPGVLLSHYERTNYSIILSFLDIDGSRIYVTNGFWKGKPAKKMQTIDFPKTLPGSGNLMSQTDVNLQQATETNILEWLPPSNKQEALWREVDQELLKLQTLWMIPPGDAGSN